MDVGSVEIMVVTYGQPELERRCLESVATCTNLERHKLTVVDNFTRDKNLGALWNELIEKSEHEYVCLLNSDTVVEADWLEKMVKCAEKCEADAVGVTTNHCGYPYQMVPRSDSYKDVAQLSGFCLLLRRASWKKAHGFREDAPFYGQESNLLRRLKRKVLCGSVFVHHEAGASVKASHRREEEQALSKYWWPRNTQFNWKKRLAVIGSPTSPFPLWRGINQAITEFQREGMAARHFDIEQINQNSALRQFAPDVVVVVNSRDSYIANAVRAMKSQSLHVPCGVWFNDLREPAKATSMAGAFSRVFLCFIPKTSEWTKMAKAPISYMPQGSVITTELKPLQDVGRVCFIGSTKNGKFHGDRSSVMEALKVKVINEEMANHRDKRIEVEAQTPEIYRSYRYVLATSPQANGYNSLRLYNIMAYGGLALVKKFQGVERLFQDQKHVLVWNDAKHAEALMTQMDGHPKEELERIRKRAWRLQQAKHTVSARLMNMVANLTTDDKSFWGYQA